MKFQRFISPVPFIVGLSVAALVAWGGSRWTKIPFWGAFALVIIAMIINGIIAEREDEAPGGFNNPLPPTNPKKEAKNADAATSTDSENSSERAEE